MKFVDKLRGVFDKVSRRIVVFFYLLSPSLGNDARGEDVAWMLTSKTCPDFKPRIGFRSSSFYPADLSNQTHGNTPSFLFHNIRDITIVFENQGYA
jgi:hypothetical protein